MAGTTEGTQEMSFLQHLEELRWHLLRGVSAILIVAVVAFLYQEYLFDTIILAPSSPDFWTNRALCQLGELIGIPSLCINQKQLMFQNIDMSGQFTTSIWVSFLAGIIVAFPYLIYEIWKFIKPALYERELRYSQNAIIVISLLFIVGVLFGYYLIVPLSIDFLGAYQVSSKVENIVTLSSYISTISSIVLSAGLIFELPVVIYFLAKMGIVSSAFLKKYQRHAIVVVVILAAIITPPDVVSQTMVCIPLLILYQVSIYIAKRIERNKARQLAG
jgi:sec-independent protein translocase protein TatC